VPDATTVWLLREALSRANLVKALFDRFNGYLNAKGYIARGGQIIDATIVSAPKQHNTREENEAIKAGQTPEGWRKSEPRMRRKTRRALDQEERPKFLRLQEPHQRRPQAQADPPLHRDGCLGA